MMTTEVSKVPVRDGSLHVERVGSGPPVVFLHGGTVDASMWDPQVPAFAARHTVVRFDARSHGRSSTATGDWSPDDDALAVLDALEIEQAVLVGSSYGGATSVDLALAHPERVRALVLAAAGITPMRFTDRFVIEQQQRQAQAIAAQDPDAYVEAFLRYGVDGPRRSPEQTAAAIRDACRAMAMATVAAHYTSVGEMRLRDAAEHLEAIDVPTLVLLPELDHTDIARVGRDAVARLPRAEARELPGVGHMANMEDPATFNTVVLDWIAALDPV